MPPVAAAATAIAATVSAAGAIAIGGTTLGAIFVNVALSAALSFAASLINKPKVPDFSSKLRDRTVMSRDPVANREIVYGRVRKSGVIIYMESTGNDNKFLHVIVQLASHEIDGVEKIYFNDQMIGERDEQGNVTTGKYEGKARVRVLLGKQDQEGDPLLVLESSGLWTVDHKLTGIAVIYVRLEYNNELFGGGIPNISVVMRGKNDIYDPREGTFGYTDNAALCLADYITDPLGLNANYSDEVDEDTLVAAANVCDEFLPLADAKTFTTDFSSNIIFSANHGLKANDRVKVSSTAILPDGLDGSVNYYVVQSNDETLKLSLTEQGLPVALSSNGAGIHSVSKCEARYTANGVLSAGEKHEENINQLAQAMAGHVPYSAGKFFILPGYYRPTNIILAEDDLRGEITVSTRLSHREAVNVVRGVYSSPENEWQLSDFPTVDNAVYKQQDNGRELPLNLELALTSSSSTAQRIAKIQLERARRQISCELPCKLNAFEAQSGDVIFVSNERFGWDNKAFEVQGYKFVVSGEEANGGLGVDLSLREIDSDVFSWNISEQKQTSPAPRTNLPDPSFVRSPTGVAITSGDAALFVKNDGTVVSRIRVVWDDPQDIFVSEGGTVEIQSKRSNEDQWQQGLFTNPAVGEFFIWDVQDARNYDVRIRLRNNTGIASEWVVFENHNVVGKTAPPSAPTSFEVIRQSDGTRQYAWTHTDKPADLAGYIIRYSQTLNVLWDDMQALQDGLLVSSPWESNLLAAGEYLFAIRSVDTSGNLSDRIIYTTVELGEPRISGVILAVYPRLQGWPGIKTNAYVDSTAELIAQSQSTWDENNDGWDNDQDWFGNTFSSIVYEQLIDIEAVFDTTPFIRAFSNGTNTIEINYSTDNVNYSGWMTPSGSISARYVNVRIQVNLPGDTPILSGLEIFFDGSPVFEEINDFDTATLTGANRIGVGDVRLPLEENYTKVRQVQLALQNTGAGWTWEVIDKDSILGPRIRIYDNTNTPADAVIDASIRGV